MKFHLILTLIVYVGICLQLLKTLQEILRESGEEPAVLGAAEKRYIGKAYITTRRIADGSVNSSSDHC